MITNTSSFAPVAVLSMQHKNPDIPTAKKKITKDTTHTPASSNDLQLRLRGLVLDNNAMRPNGQPTNARSHDQAAAGQPFSSIDNWVTLSISGSHSCSAQNRIWRDVHIKKRISTPISLIFTINLHLVSIPALQRDAHKAIFTAMACIRDTSAHIQYDNR